MNRMLAPASLPKLKRTQTRYQRRTRRHGRELPTPVSRTVRRRDQRRDLVLGEHGLDLHEPDHRQTGAPREPDKLHAASHQQGFDTVFKTGLDHDLRLRRPGKEPFRDGLGHYIPAGGQPQTPARQRSGDVHRDPALRIDDKTQQFGLWPNLTRHKAAPRRPRQTLFFDRRRDGLSLDRGRRWDDGSGSAQTGLLRLFALARRRFVGEPMGARGHDDGVCLFLVQLGAGAGHFDQFVGSKIGRITPVGVITEFGLPTATANPGQIASQAGALYFTETGDPALAFGGPAGSKIAKFSVPAYFPPVHVAAVFSTSQNTTQSYLRLYNSGTVGGTAKLTISDYTTGLAIASYTTPVIAPNTAPQIGMATLEAAATTTFTKPTYYTVTVEPQFTGSVAHVLYRPADGTLTNLSTCDRATTAGLQQVANVHTKFVGNNLFPSSIVVYNGALTATPVTLTVYDATTGNSLGTYTTASIPANGQVVVPVSTIEPNLNIPSGLLHYSVKVTSALTGYIQHLVNNTQPGVITDMSTVCALGASN